MKGIETLDKGDYVHFDIKPANILIFVNMVLKITDFGLLRNQKDTETDQNKVKIPGGTIGYLSRILPKSCSFKRKFKKTRLFFLRFDIILFKIWRKYVKL